MKQSPKPVTGVGRHFQHVRVGGVPTAVASLEELVEAMVEDAPKIRRLGERPKLVFDVNGQGLSMYATNPSYKEAIDVADIVHADGQFIVVASKFLSAKPVKNRSSTTDLFIDSLQPAAEHSLSYFLLGGEERVNEACASHIVERFPAIKLCGRRNGFFAPDDEQGIIDCINNSGCDVLWVGLGKPKEQSFCIRNRDSLKVGWIVTCGGLFNYITGDYPRAPLWMQNFGIEWVHRLVSNPRHLFWRYLTTNPHAIWLTLTRVDRAALK